MTLILTLRSFPFVKNGDGGGGDGYGDGGGDDGNTTSNGDNKPLWGTLHPRQSPQSFMCTTPYIF